MTYRAGGCGSGSAGEETPRALRVTPRHPGTTAIFQKKVESSTRNLSEKGIYITNDNMLDCLRRTYADGRVVENTLDVWHDREQVVAGVPHAVEGRVDLRHDGLVHRL